MEKVLVVNDSQFERLIMKDIVSRLGYEVKTADEYDTLSLIESYNPNIVIANMTMNSTSGDRLIEAIKGKKPDIKCYLSSCSTIAPNRLHYRGIDGYIVTPTTPGLLEKILQYEVQEIKATGPDAIIYSEDIKTIYDHNDNLPIREDATIFSFCPYCGQKIAESKSAFVFCPFCGSKF